MLRKRLLIAGLVMCACGPQASQPTLDASVLFPPDDGGNVVALDAGADAGLDAGLPQTGDAGVDGGMNSDAGSTATDGGCVRIAAALVVCPRPPVGATLCGTGDFTTATTRPACDALDTGELSTQPVKNCGSLAGVSGHYEAYCGATDLYLWVGVDAVTSDAVMECTTTGLLLDGGMITSMSHQLRWALDGINSRRSVLVTPELADGGGSRVELLDQMSRQRQLESQPFTNDPTLWTGSFALESSFHLTDRVRTTGEFVFPARTVDCHQVATTSVSTVLLTVPFVADPL